MAEALRMYVRSGLRKKEDCATAKLCPICLLLQCPYMCPTLTATEEKEEEEREALLSASATDTLRTNVIDRPE